MVSFWIGHEARNDRARGKAAGHVVFEAGARRPGGTAHPGKRRRCASLVSIGLLVGRGSI